MPLSQTLIESALKLTGKEEWEFYKSSWEVEFSIEKFFYYLLSPEFIEKYMPLLFSFEITYDYEGYLRHTAIDFGEAIYEYQLGNSEPLENLLSKI